MVGGEKLYKKKLYVALFYKLIDFFERIVINLWNYSIAGFMAYNQMGLQSTLLTLKFDQQFNEALSDQSSIEYKQLQNQVYNGVR